GRLRSSNNRSWLRHEHAQAVCVYPNIQYSRSLVDLAIRMDQTGSPALDRERTSASAEDVGSLLKRAKKELQCEWSRVEQVHAAQHGQVETTVVDRRAGRDETVVAVL